MTPVWQWEPRILISSQYQQDFKYAQLLSVFYLVSSTVFRSHGKARRIQPYSENKQSAEA